jgi:hypothetical protein
MEPGAASGPRPSRRFTQRPRGARRSDRRPRSLCIRLPTPGRNPPPQGPRPVAESEAPSDSHRGKHEGKIDPSRELLSAGDTRVGAGDDRGAPPGRDFGDSGGWPRGAGDDGIYPGNGDGNNAGHGHSEDRDKTPRRREESDTRAGEKQRNKQPAPVSREGTGQPVTIMAG